MRTVLMAAVAALLLVPATAWSEPRSTEIGGDVYTSGDTAALSAPAERDAFFVGGDVRVSLPVGGTAHVAGFDIEASAPVDGDIYAIGNTVRLDGPIGGDLSATGMRVETGPEAAVAGNARIGARRVAIGAPVAGSLLVGAGRLTLAAPVAGDLVFTGNAIEFGEGAKVGGTLTIHAESALDVPASVATPDRVRFEAVDLPGYVERFGEGAGRAVGVEAPSRWSIALALLGMTTAVVLLGMLLLALVGGVMERLRETIEGETWRSLGYGLIGLSTLLGLVPLAVITLVGLPLIPVIIVAAFAVMVFAWTLGAYAVAHRTAQGFGRAPTGLGGRLLTLTLGVLALLVLNALPFVGWLVNTLVMLMGFGALQMRLVDTLRGGRVREVRLGAPGGGLPA